MDKLQAFVSEQLKKEVPEVKVGDTVKVHDKIKEGNRERIQIFEGTVIAKSAAESAKHLLFAVFPTV